MSRSKSPKPAAPEPAPSAPPADAPVRASPPAPPSAAEIEDLRKQAADRDAWRDTAQRVQADFINYQNRVKRDRDLDRKFGSEPLCRALLPTLDNFEKALAACPADTTPPAVLEGMRLIHRELLRSLELQGVKRLESLSRPFDASTQEVVTMREAADVSPGTVLEEVRAGYLLHDRVIRPAQVILARAPKPVSDLPVPPAQE
ncbi:MAG: nucleotide exchange factor GrpE [Planctomycetes bacterium]|nr:nucleotide exchange factor GrpE [Planctomycetota bacterium]